MIWSERTELREKGRGKSAKIGNIIEFNDIIPIHIFPSRNVNVNFSSLLPIYHKFHNQCVRERVHVCLLFYFHWTLSLLITGNNTNNNCSFIVNEHMRLNLFAYAQIAREKQQQSSRIETNNTRSHSITQIRLFWRDIVFVINMFHSLTRRCSHLICMCNCKLIQNYVAQQMLEVSRMTCDLLSVHKWIFICMTPTFTVIHSRVLFVEQHQLTILFRLLPSILYIWYEYLFYHIIQSWQRLTEIIAEMGMYSKTA